MSLFSFVVSYGINTCETISNPFLILFFFSSVLSLFFWWTFKRIFSFKTFLVGAAKVSSFFVFSSFASRISAFLFSSMTLALAFNCACFTASYLFSSSSPIFFTSSSPSHLPFNAFSINASRLFSSSKFFALKEANAAAPGVTSVIVSSFSLICVVILLPLDDNGLRYYRREKRKS